ncbi:DNA damage-inducible transcript 4-like protein [Halotydeus destructor]|nr:DNA damage-inducible transcript 4-like protein [Halotydeus destructor]
MYESPSDMLLSTGHNTGERMPSIGQVVSKVSNLVANSQPAHRTLGSKQSEQNSLHSRFYTDHTLKDIDQDIENREPVIRDDLPPSYDEVADSEIVIRHIATKIEVELKEAKRTSLDCGEVLVPCNLTQQIAQDIMAMSESEPCGLRGGVMYINLEESDHSDLRRVGCIKLGNSVPTFEMYLNLKKSSGSWINQVSNRLFKNFNRNSIIISEGYQLSKKKLYRSDSISA